MANILISSLGSGQKRNSGYQKATYQFNGKTYTTTFISRALTKFLKIDKLYLIGTNGSIWDSCYTQFGGKDENIEFDLYEKIENKTLQEKDLLIVNQTIDKALGKDGSKSYIIKYGLNEKELWGNFNKYLQILEDINDEDIVYIDITHAFRSLSLMSFLMVQFGHTIKNKKFKIGGIFYGMLEYARENNNITPIIDLKIFYELMEWIKAIDNFKNYANGDNIALLLKNEQKYKSEYNLFKNYSDSMRIANMEVIRQNVNTLSKKLEILQNSKNPIIALMSDEIIKFIKRLNKDRLSNFQLELANWYYEHKHYALSYIALAEAIVSKMCEIKKLNISSKNDRDKCKKEIWTVNKDLYKKVYKNVNKIRKNIAHQLQTRKDAMHADIKNLKSYLKNTKKYFNDIDKQM